MRDNDSEAGVLAEHLPEGPRGRVPGRGGATETSRALLQRQLDQSRDDLIDAFERARAVSYQPDSAQVTDMQVADRRYRHARSLWQDRHRPGVDPTVPSSDAADDAPTTLIDLTPDRRVDLDDPSLDVPHQRADRQRPDGQGPGDKTPGQAE